MQKHSRIILSALLILTVHTVCAQFYESGVNPPSVRWQQINTEHFRVIFPTDIPERGQHAANVLEYIYHAESKTLRHRPAKISVVLHNRPSSSNGVVAWAPKRSEWLLTPPQDSYAQDWTEQLALHEFRHVVQTDKLNQGLTKALGYLFGQQAVGVAAGMLPAWFLEGDAVVAETAMSRSGRGRSASFEMPLRTIALSGKYHHYDKAIFGSYRRHVPNHYEWGYQMTAWTRKEYGTEVFAKAEDNTGRRLWSLYPFELGLKKQTGYLPRQLYYRAFDDLTRQWKEQEKRYAYVLSTPVNRQTSRLYTSYRSPHYLTDSTFVALKTGMAQIACFVKVNRNGDEQTLFTPGMLNSDRFSCAGGLMAWSEEIPDVRWSNRSYSVIKIFDISRRKERTLTRRTRFFSPSLSPDAGTVAAVEVSLGGESAIVLLDVTAGVEKMVIKAPENTLLQTPSWSKDGKYLLAIAVGSGGKSIVRIDTATGWFATVLAPSYDDISCPSDGGTCAFFTGQCGGINNIMAVDYQTKEVFRATASRFGAFDPQPDATGEKLLFAEYSELGYNLTESNIRKETIPEDDHSPQLWKTLAEQENFNLQDSIINYRDFPVKPFRKWQHLISVHSWAPLYYQVNVSDPLATEIYPGLVLLSQDLQGNMIASAGYSWRGYHALHAGFTYKGWYPVVEMKITYGGERKIYGKQPEDATLPPNFRNTEISVNTYVPFNLTRNRYITGLTPQIQINRSSDFFFSNEQGHHQSGFLESLYGIAFYRYLKTAVRDLAPAWGVTLQGAFKHAPANENLFSSMYYVYGRTYLPGLARHHSLQLSVGVQRQHAGEYLFGSMLAFPRGYATGRTEQLNIALAEYAFPFLYPDKNLAFLVYLKRLSANLFCHAAENRYRIVWQQSYVWQSDRMLSVGADLLADVHLLRITYPVNMGLRAVYIPERKEFQSSLLFQVSFR
ncbi:MAG: hypothetical protein LBS09_01300 [Bacteroidales bacterium]|jgi:hypothetical protein|nr:hypothetical protein [Bacteroidales bacterium]